MNCFQSPFLLLLFYQTPTAWISIQSPAACFLQSINVRLQEPSGASSRSGTHEYDSIHAGQAAVVPGFQELLKGLNGIYLTVEKQWCCCTRLCACPGRRRRMCWSNVTCSRNWLGIHLTLAIFKQQLICSSNIQNLWQCSSIQR